MNIKAETEKKVFDYMEARGMAAPHDRIVAGVSGGADSVCLLFLLLEYAKKVPLQLSVAHVNHGVRQAAAADAGYVEEMCRQAGVPFFLTETDVHRLALKEKCSEEDMGRRVRYEAFRQAAENMGAAKIALAHNSNDNAETMLFHLFRGSGLRGLGGIAPMRREGKQWIIRPILCLRREEVEAYLRERRISWRTDETNLGDCYRRNRIRHHVLPYVEQEVASGAAGHMCRTADMLRETEDYLEQQTAEALGYCLAAEDAESVSEIAACGKENAQTAVLYDAGNGRAVRAYDAGNTTAVSYMGRRRYVIAADVFLSFHQVIQKRMLLTLLEELSPFGKDIFQVHIRDTMTLFTERSNRSICLPFGIMAWRQYEKVILERRLSEEERKIPGQLWQQAVPMPSLEETTDFFVSSRLENGQKMEFSFIFIRKGWKVPRNQYTKWFDYDKIKESLTIRFRRPGDFLTIADGTGKIIHKSLKDYMITEKIPKQLRNEIPVVAEGSHVLWLVGWRISEYFKVGENTKHVLQVKLFQGDMRDP